jgi:hypothetical protein
MTNKDNILVCKLAMGKFKILLKYVQTSMKFPMEISSNKRLLLKKIEVKEEVLSILKEYLKKFKNNLFLP